MERSSVRLSNLTGALLGATRKAAGRLVTRTEPSGLIPLTGVVFVALPAIELLLTGAKIPLADGRGYRSIPELLGSISFETPVL